MQQIVCKKNIMIETNKQMCAHNENQNQFLFLYNFSKVQNDLSNSGAISMIFTCKNISTYMFCDLSFIKK